MKVVKNYTDHVVAELETGTWKVENPEELDRPLSEVLAERKKQQRGALNRERENDSRKS